jgi:hypothetical protein
MNLQSAVISAEFSWLEGKGLLHSQEVFALASKIKRALTSTLSPQDEEKMLKLKSNLPKSVQFIIWNEEVVITNEHFKDEYLYASTFFKDVDRRYVLGWIPGGSSDFQSSWVFSTIDDGSTFKIKCVFHNEYLYPDNNFKDNVRRNVFTWRRKSLEPEFFWKVELLGDDKIRIKSANYNEYFYAENSTYAFSPNRRSVFTGVDGHACDDSCNWMLKEANNSTKCRFSAS